MNMFKCWAGVMIAVLFLAKVAVSADAAKEAYEKGESFLEKKDYDAAITAFTDAIRLDRKMPGHIVAVPLRTGTKANTTRRLRIAQMPSG